MYTMYSITSSVVYVLQKENLIATHAMRVSRRVLHLARCMHQARRTPLPPSIICCSVYVYRVVCSVYYYYYTRYSGLLMSGSLGYTVLV